MSAPLVAAAMSGAPTAGAAVDEALGQIDLDAAGFLLVFAPDRLDHDGLAEALHQRAPGLPVWGAVTPGRVGPRGYDADEALLVLAFPARHFRASARLLSPLSGLGIDDMAADAMASAEAGSFALLFPDHRARAEDLLIATLATAMEGVPVFGGSVGPAPGAPAHLGAVLHGGRFHADAALVLLIETDLAMRGFGFTHVLPTDRTAIVTDADAENRRVCELNGTAAAVEYARLVGCGTAALDRAVFAENPLLSRANGGYHVRAVAEALPDDTLRLLSGVDDGEVLTLGQGIQVLGALEAGLDLADAEGRAPGTVLAFDCVLRRLEIEEKGIADAVDAVFAARGVVGINTYGEQHCGLHLNQTFVGVALWPPGQGAR